MIDSEVVNSLLSEVERLEEEQNSFVLAKLTRLLDILNFHISILGSSSHLMLLIGQAERRVELLSGDSTCDPVLSLEQAVSLDPLNFNAYIELAKIRMHTSPPEAIDLLRKANKIYWTFEALYELAYCEHFQNDFDSAENYIDQARLVLESQLARLDELQREIKLFRSSLK